ncbi:MAG TPA: hypothetical protein VFO67_11425 [Gemmatimonadales bacterium]|nr:hypothetical protein [Gemmatimonadales bacterium]
MTRLAFAILVAVVCGSAGTAAQATEVTGKWTGTLTFSINGQQQPVFMILTQKGTELTGSAGPREDRQWPMVSGKVEGGKATFEVQTDGPLLKFSLTLTDGRLKGEASGEAAGQTMTAAVDVDRVK